MVRVITCHVISHGFKSRFFRKNYIKKNMLFNYSNVFIYLIFSLSLSIFIFCFSFFLIKQKDDVEKLTAYECGFNPYNDARKIFDVKFYLVAILFIIFDLEAIFIFPWALTLDVNFFFGFWSMIDFLIELIFGFIYIWYSDALEW